MPPRIDFRELRSKLRFEKVLELYKVEVKRKGVQHHGFCPLPNHNGKRNSPSFSANLERGIFQCFGCGAKGNMLDFAALMDDTSLVGAATKLEEHFHVLGMSGKATAPTLSPPKQSELKPGLPRKVNEPLGFELQNIDAEHAYLKGRGFTPATIAHFGLGFCSRGLMKNRAVIPLRDEAGRLIGYAGRAVDDKMISEDFPRYLFPGDRERNGVIHEFRKGEFIYNGFAIREPVENLLVVEGFTSVWWLHQNGFSKAVATMGAACSERQAQLIVAKTAIEGIVWIFADGDEAGLRWAGSLFEQVAPARSVRLVKCPQGKQPTDLPYAALCDIFGKIC